MSFEKEKLEEEAGLENAMLADTAAPALEEKKEKSKPAAESKKKKAKTNTEKPEDTKPSEQEQDPQQDTQA